MGTRGRRTEDAITLYVRELLRLWETPPPEGQGRTQMELAKLAGCSRSQLSMIRTERMGVGYRTARGLAKAWGMTLAELEQRAGTFARKGTASLPASADRYPNRQAAVDFADGEVSKEAVDYVRNLDAAGAADLSRLFWLDRLREADAMLKSALRQQAPAAEKRTNNKK